MAINLDLSMSRGDTLKYIRSYGIDLTDGKAWFTAKRNFTDADSAALISLSSTTSGVTISDAITGELTITIPPSGTAALTTPVPPTPLALFYDIQVKESDGTITTVQRGKLLITGDVTISTT